MPTLLRNAKTGGSKEHLLICKACPNAGVQLVWNRGGKSNKLLNVNVKNMHKGADGTVACV